MTVPTVRFLEQLMPSGLDTLAAVRAALPARFAPPGFTTHPGDENAIGEVGDIARAERGVPPTDVRARDEAHSRGAIKPAAPLPPVAPPRWPLGAAALSPDAAGGRGGESHSDAPRAPDGIQGSPSPMVAATPIAAPSPRSHSSAEIAVGRTAASAGTMTRGETTAAARAPLRAQTRAHRAALSGEQPTIVHVTIDRIDVRAPAASAPSERPAPKKRSGLSQSLSDYLRQRDRAQGGAGGGGAA
jgi:hypothetical protein